MENRDCKKCNKPILFNAFKEWVHWNYEADKDHRAEA